MFRWYHNAIFLGHGIIITFWNSGGWTAFIYYSSTFLKDEVKMRENNDIRTYKKKWIRPYYALGAASINVSVHPAFRFAKHSIISIVWRWFWGFPPTASTKSWSTWCGGKKSLYGKIDCISHCVYILFLSFWVSMIVNLHYLVSLVDTSRFEKFGEFESLVHIYNR